jgi:hypothetical protein
MTTQCSIHYAAVLRILCYVKRTLFHGLHFSSRSSLDLHVYSDVDWVGDLTDRRSTTGIVSYLVILSSLGVARNNLLLLALTLRLSIVLLLTPPLSFSSSIGYYMI